MSACAPSKELGTRKGTEALFFRFFSRWGGLVECFGVKTDLVELSLDFAAQLFSHLLADLSANILSQIIKQIANL